MIIFGYDEDSYLHSVCREPGSDALLSNRGGGDHQDDGHDLQTVQHKLAGNSNPSGPAKNG